MNRDVKSLSRDTWWVYGMRSKPQLRTFINNLPLLFDEECVLAVVYHKLPPKIAALADPSRTGPHIVDPDAVCLTLTPPDIAEVAGAIYGLVHVFVYRDDEIMLAGHDISFGLVEVSGAVDEEDLKRVCEIVPCLYERRRAASEDERAEHDREAVMPGERWRISQPHALWKSVRHFHLLFPGQATMAVRSSYRSEVETLIAEFLQSRPSGRKRLSHSVAADREESLEVRDAMRRAWGLERTWEEALGVATGRDNPAGKSDPDCPYFAARGPDETAVEPVMVPYLPDEYHIDITPDNMADLSRVLEMHWLHQAENGIGFFYIHEDGRELMWGSPWPRRAFFLASIEVPEERIRAYCSAVPCRYSARKR